MTAIWAAHLGAVLSHAIWPTISCINLYSHQLLKKPIEVGGATSKYLRDRVWGLRSTKKRSRDFASPRRNWTRGKFIACRCRGSSILSSIPTELVFIWRQWCLSLLCTVWGRSTPRACGSRIRLTTGRGSGQISTVAHCSTPCATAGRASVPTFLKPPRSSVQLAYLYQLDDLTADE